MTRLSRGGGVSLWDQIRQVLLRDIESGVLEPGSQLPGEHDIARRFGVSLAPVRAAMSALASSGHVVRIQGRGTFVRKPPLQVEVGLYPGITDTLAKAAGSKVEVLEQRRSTPPDWVLDGFGDPPPATVWLRRVFVHEDRRIALVDSWLDAERFADLEDVPGFDQGLSLYRVLRERYHVIVRSRGGTLAVEPPEPEIAEQLNCAPGSPVVRVLTSAEDEQGVAVEVARLCYDPGVFVFRLPGSILPRTAAGADHG